MIKFIKNLKFDAQREEDFLKRINADFFAEKMARIRVLDPYKKELNESPFPLEVDYEKKNLKKLVRKKGIIYSASHFLNILKEEFHNSLNINEKWIIYLSDQLLATFEDRWHIRVIILGIPVIISVPGIVYGPARSREYYVSASIGVPQADEDYVKENDKRKTDILKGYLFQAIYFYLCILRGKEFKFCDNNTCSLYNSHWQEEVLKVQLKHNLCKRHLKEFKI